MPVEHEVNKKLEISSSEAVLQMGIGKYNAECKNIMMQYAGEWRQVIERLGRWIDFDDDYKVRSRTSIKPATRANKYS